MVTRQERDRAALAALERSNRAAEDGLRVLRRARGRQLTPAETRRYQKLEDRRRGAFTSYEWHRRRRWQLWLGVALLAVLVAALGWIWVRPAGAAPGAYRYTTVTFVGELAGGQALVQTEDGSQYLIVGGVAMGDGVVDVGPVAFYGESGGGGAYQELARQGEGHDHWTVVRQ